MTTTRLSIPPPARIAIGSFEVGGERGEVFLSLEWARYFESLNKQVVVTTDAIGLPGAPGTTGAAGVGVSLSEGAESSVEFIPLVGARGMDGTSGPPVFLLQAEPETPDMLPGPKGDAGPKGDTGPALFLLQSEPETPDLLGVPTKFNEAYIAPTLLNSWVNFDASHTQAGYFKDASGMVHLRGLIKDGTINTTAFVLPVGYRPSLVATFASPSNAGAGGVYVDASGNVNPFYGSNLYIGLDGMNFRAAET